MDTQLSEENTGKKTGESKSSRCWDNVKVPVLGGSMSMSDLVNHIGHCISGQVGQVPSGNPLISADGSPNKDMLEDLAQYLLGDSQIASASDEKSLMTRVNSLYSLLHKDSATHQSMGDLAQYLLGDSHISSASDEQSLMKRVNSLYCILHKDSNTYQSMCIDNAAAAAAGGNYCSDDGPLFPPGPYERKPSTSERKPLFDLSAADDFNDTYAYKQPPPSISRKDSFAELLMHLPRIASLPQVLFNIAEDPENQAR